MPRLLLAFTLPFLLVLAGLNSDAQAKRRASPKISQKVAIAPPHFAGKTASQMLNAHPPGPVLTESTVNDPDVKTLDDLKRLYRVPKTFRYAMTTWHQPILIRIKDGARFSISASRWKNKSGMLTIDTKRKDKKRGWRYDTSEIMRRDLEPGCVKSWGYPDAKGKICITGFGRGGVPYPKKR